MRRQWRALKHFCDGPPEYGLNTPASEYRNEGMRFLRTSDISEDGSLSSNGGVFVNGHDLEPRHRLKGGDLLLSRSGTLGRCLRYVESHGPATFAGYLVRFRPRLDSEARYLQYCSQAKFFQDTIASEAVTSTISNFNAERYGALAMPWWPASQQRAIADYLDTETARIDALITKKRRLIDLLDARFRAEAQSKLTGSPDDLGWKPGPYWLGRVPLSWQPKKIAWCKVTGSGTTPESGNSRFYGEDGTPWVTTSELRELAIDGVDRYVTEAALANYSALKVFPVGAVLIAMYGATVGRLAVLGIAATTNQACCAIYGGEGLDQRFLYWWLWAHREHIVDMAYGSGQPNISQEVVRGLRIPAPSEAEQRSIAADITVESARVSALEDLLQRQIDLLTEHRQALITAAVTGEFAIPGAA